MKIPLSQKSNGMYLFHSGDFDKIAELVLRPASGGRFEVRADGQTVWSRKAEGRFPDITELKQRVRDRIAPDRDLGHG